jgi:hypothetical protein
MNNERRAESRRFGAYDICIGGCQFLFRASAEVLLLFSMEDVDKAKTFTASDDLREAMEKAGVSDKPDVYFLE